MVNIEWLTMLNVNYHYETISLDLLGYGCNVWFVHSSEYIRI